jgi:hypothetical protein
MANAKDLKPDTTFLKVFATGDFGTGKSVFASTFPTPGYVFDFDKGIEIYAGGDWEYNQFELSPPGWVAFEKKFREVRDRVKQGEFKTVVIDSTTSLSDMAMERALQLDPKRSATDGPLWNVHYQHVRNLMEPKLRGFTNWNCNLVMIAHLKVTQDMETGAIISIDPLLTGQLAERVPGYFGEVYVFFTKNVQGKTEYRIRTVTRGHYKARSRLSGMKRLLHDEIPNHYEAVRGSYQKKLEELKQKEEGK